MVHVYIINMKKSKITEYNHHKKNLYIINAMAKAIYFRNALNTILKAF